MKRGDRTPLALLHRRRLLVGLRPARTRSPSPLYGKVRGIAHPKAGIAGMQRMGDVVHALAQRHVAGVIEVHAPFADDVARGERMPGEKKKRR